MTMMRTPIIVFVACLAVATYAGDAGKPKPPAGKDAVIPNVTKVKAGLSSGMTFSRKLMNSERMKGYRKKALAEYRAELDKVNAKYKAEPEDKFGPKWILVAKANLQFVKDGFVPPQFISFDQKKSLTMLLYASAFPKARHYLPPSCYELELGKDLGRKTPIATVRSWSNAYYSDNPKRVYEFWEGGALGMKRGNAFWELMRKRAGIDGLTRMMIFSEFYTTIDKTEYCLLPVRMESPDPKPLYYLRIVVVKKVGGEWFRSTDLDGSLYQKCWFDQDWRCRTRKEYDAELAKCSEFYLHFDKLYPAYSSRWDDWRFSHGSVDADKGDAAKPAGKDAAKEGPAHVISIYTYTAKKTAENEMNSVEFVPGKFVFLGKKPLLTSANIASIEVINGRGGKSLKLKLDNHGRMTWVQATAKHRGKNLIVMLDKTYKGWIRIQRIEERGILVLPGPFTDDEVKNIKKNVKDRKTP